MKTAQASVIHVINKIPFVEITALQDVSFVIYCNIIIQRMFVHLDTVCSVWYVSIAALP